MIETLTGTVQPAPPGSRGFDTDTPLTSCTAKAFHEAGFRFAIRYLSLGATEQPGDVTAEEVQAILGEGLTLMAVQHVPEPGWRPTAPLGEEYGANAACNAHSAGLPPGMNIWLDLEGVNSGSPASQVSSYCNAWFEQVSAAGYFPGLYVGAGAVLDEEQLNALQVNFFWKSGRNTGSQQPGSCFEYLYPEKGYCMVQSISGTAQIDGVSYDSDVIKKDNCGDTPLWLARAVRSAPASHPIAEAFASRAPVLSAPFREPDFLKGVASPPRSRSITAMIGIAMAAVILYFAGIVSSPFVLQKLGYSTPGASTATANGHSR
jgi:hypothetical protein